MIALDGVRGLAVLLVTISHAGWPVLKFGGIAGVTLFFVLSGYLITGILAREHSRTGRIDLGGFYLRRARRLFPALALMLVLYVLLALASGLDRTALWQSVLAAGLYFANVQVASDGWSMGWLGHTWSLAMEEQFYLLWPVLLLALLPRRRRLAIGVLVVVVLVSLAARVAHGWEDLESYQHAMYMPWTNVFALAAGSALALAPHPRPAPRHVGVLALTGLMITAGPMGLLNGIHSGANYGQRVVAGPLTAAFALALIWAASNGQLSRVLEDARLVFFGWISYGLYLWHLVLMGFLGQFVDGGTVTRLVVGTVAAAVSVVLAVLSRGWLESMFLGEQPGIHRIPVRRASTGPAGPTGRAPISATSGPTGA